MKSLFLSMVAMVMFITSAEARDQIRIVGSSTVFPFSTAVAENFGKTTDYKTPIVESTGSGGGLKLFCAGVGDQHPDITNASRKIKSTEIQRCRDNGVKNIYEVKIGYDGIVLANSKNGSLLNISLTDIFLALAKTIPNESGIMVPNPNIKWSDIRSDLPNIRIEVMGPPPTSGTRDAFVELAMEGGAKTFAELATLKKNDKHAFKVIAHTLREDGAYIEAGENDNLIIQKLQANETSYGIFGFSFLDQNSDVIQGSIINGADPSFDNISSGVYNLSRGLYFYVKGEHMDVIPGIKEYVAEFGSKKASGDEGYLSDKGLIPLSGERPAPILIK